MKSVQVELPDKLADELGLLVKTGWFGSEEEAVRIALMEFVHRHRFELLERFQREDVAWALQQKEATKP
jgi:Arc/MetJ-type ribon-helix-helix transcriptional regulator